MNSGGNSGGQNRSWQGGGNGPGHPGVFNGNPNPNYRGNNTTTTIGIEAIAIGGQQVIDRRISISKLLVILGSLVRLEISLVTVMLMGPIHQL
jgi:hypothetical protein